MEEKKGISRRGFLKTAAAVGAALTIQPAINKVKAANAALNGENVSTMKKGGMPHRTLGTGRAAFEVSALGFGVMGMTYNRSQHPDKKQCIRLLHEAVERGVTLFDTAIIYGPLTNENLAGEALSEFKGRINVTTKFGHEVIDGKGTGRQDSSRKTVRRYCEDSLRRLRLETLPMFYQHRADPDTPAEEVAQTIAELMKEGKVQHWGMCEVSAETIRRAHAVCPLTAIQSEYHLMHRDVETNGVLDVCRELGIGFVPHDPDGFQFAELLHQHAPRRTLYRMLKLHGAVDALGHAINQIGLPFRAHDILRNRHAAVEIYRGYLIFVHTLQMYINPAIREKNHTVINLSHIAVV